MITKNRIFLLLFIILTLFIVSCNIFYLFDSEPPIAYIISPEDGISVWKDTGRISIRVRAYDNDSYITAVHLYVDGKKGAELYDNNLEYIDSVYCFEFTWNPYSYADCLPHEIYAIAYDAGNNSVTTDPIYITVLQEHYAKTNPLIYNISSNSAIAEGMVSCDNGNPVIERGMCWSSSEEPTINDPRTSDGYGLGTYTSQITELDPSSLYFARAYATNDSLTFYGGSIGFLTAPEETPEYEMIYIESGSFQMGNVWDSTLTGKPVHTVTLDSFLIGKYELTQDLYLSIMGTNTSGDLGSQLPLNGVDWIDAVIFCNVYSSSEGYDHVYTIDSTRVTWDFSKNGFRLPTEAEWEYAARSRGRNDRKWSGTSNYDSLNYYAWLHVIGNNVQVVGTKFPNDIGLYDMTGNISEWCWNVPRPYPSTPVSNPKEQSINLDGLHIVRGYSVYDHVYSRYNSSYRYVTSGYVDSDSKVGIRLARKVE